MAPMKVKMTALTTAHSNLATKNVERLSGRIHSCATLTTSQGLMITTQPRMITTSVTSITNTTKLTSQSKRMDFQITTSNQVLVAAPVHRITSG